MMNNNCASVQKILGDTLIHLLLIPCGDLTAGRRSCTSLRIKFPENNFSSSPLLFQPLDHNLLIFNLLRSFLNIIRVYIRGKKEKKLLWTSGFDITEEQYNGFLFLTLFSSLKNMYFYNMIKSTVSRKIFQSYWRSPQ